MNLIKSEIYKFFIEYKKNYKKNIISAIFYSVLLIIFYTSIVNVEDGFSKFTSYGQFYYFLIYFLAIRVILAAISGPISIIYEESRKKKLVNMDSNHFPLEKIILARSVINFINTFLIMLLIFIIAVVFLDYGIPFVSLILIAIYLFVGSLSLLGIGFIVAGLVVNFQLKTVVIVLFQLAIMALLFINIRSDFIVNLLPFVRTFKDLYGDINLEITLNLLYIFINSFIYLLVGYKIFCILAEKMKNKIGIKYLDIIK